MTFAIRPAQPADAPAIAHVHVESWKTTYTGIVPEAFIASMDKEALSAAWQLRIADPSLCILVAEDPTGVFGFLCGGPIREPLESYDGELHAIYLLRSHQQQGAGRAMLLTLAANLRARGLHSMLVWALEQNPAVHFYKRLGAIEVLRKIIHIGGADLLDIALGWPSLDQLTGNTP